MKKKIAIILSDPNSVNYEIVEKSFPFFCNKNLKNEYYFIGSKNLFKKKIKKNLKKIKMINISYDKKSNYVKDLFKKAFDLINKKKIDIIINLPLNKKEIFGKSFAGVTEYLAKNFNKKNKETMLLYNDNFSVSPITTHIKIKDISRVITKDKIINNVKNICDFYARLKKKKINIGILGLNPHNGMDFDRNTEEKKIIIPAIKEIKKLNLCNIYGPLSPDSSFLYRKINKLDNLIGLYHDQVLTTFKYINEFKAINITLGLPFIRISPDHGTAKNIKNKNKANPESFLYALKFCEKFANSL